MKVTFEDDVLYLPIVEAKSIQEGKTVSLLFNIPDCYIHNTNRIFELKNSEPCYPAIIVNKEKEKIADSYCLKSAACQSDGNDRIRAYQLVQFWHYVGDGTHCSDFVSTPFGFYPGLQVTIENRYNVKPTPVIVTDITLTRVAEEKWYWMIVLQKL